MIGTEQLEWLLEITWCIEVCVLHFLPSHSAFIVMECGFYVTGSESPMSTHILVQ